MRATHAIYNIYKLISFFQLLFAVFYKKLLSDQDFMKVIHSNFLSAIHGFWDNDVLLPTGYDVIVSPPPGVFHAIFHDGFWNSDHDFLIAFHNNFLSGMHGFRDNEALLQAGYDVIVISPPEGAPRDYSSRILKEWTWIPDGVP